MPRRTRIDIFRGILLVGLASAAAVWFTAHGPADNPLGNPLADSKNYQRTIEMIGGTSNLLASQFTDWIKGLWQGRNLGYTLAVLTLAGALGFLVVTEDPPAQD